VRLDALIVLFFTAVVGTPAEDKFSVEITRDEALPKRILIETREKRIVYVYDMGESGGAAESTLPTKSLKELVWVGKLRATAFCP